jgi:hypothetical protein
MRSMIPEVSMVVVISALLTTSCAAPPEDEVTGRLLSETTAIGAATAGTYAEFDDAGAPTAIGFVFSANFFDELPTEMSDLHQCFDRDGNGEVAQPDECNFWHEWAMPLPGDVVAREDIPFSWALLNWNPVGHIPPGVYDTPHFDMHFYIQPMDDVFAIEPGPCGPEFVRCDQFDIARKPVPPNYLAPDYADVEAVAPAMGNHLIDLTSGEFQGEPFTRTWIFGKYDGQITFYEEMVTKAYMEGRPSTCFPIKSPPAVGLSGYYPTSSCLRFDAAANEFTVSMEDFTYREATPADPIPAAGEGESDD